MRRPGAEHPSARIAVVRDSQLVPLIETPRDQIPTRESPWNDIVLEQHIVRPGEIPEHEHPNLCLHLQIGGDREFEWWQNGRNAIERTSPESLIVIPQGARHRWRWQGSSERLILSVEDDALQRVASQLGAQHRLEIKGAWSILVPSTRFLISEMGREAREGWPLGALYADLLALSLQTDLIKNHSSEQIAFPLLKGRLGVSKLKRVMEYMSANLAEDIGLEQIANELAMSSSHFAHEFRNSTGTTPYQYLLQQRLERAKRLLESTSLPIQNVSILTGFNYPANFVRTFRQRAGQSPDAWRKDHSR